jgi:predicted phage-related endonuclease
MAIERVKFDPENASDREAWLRERMNYINASEMAIVCGEGSWGSLAELYAEKKGLRPPQADNKTLRRGRWGESSVFDALREERPEWVIVRAKLHLRDRERRIAATPDGFASVAHRPGHGIVQAKIIGRSIYREKWLDDPSGDILGAATPPAHYRIQVITEMMLSECSWGVLAVLINGEHTWELALLDVERDGEIEQGIVDNTAAFYRDYFDPGIMPEFEPQRDARLIKALYPKDNGEMINLRGDNRALVATEDLVQKREGLKKLKDEIDALETELKAKLAHNTYGVLDDGRCLSWKHHHRKAHTVKASDYRVLRVLNLQPKELNQ